MDDGNEVSIHALLAECDGYFPPRRHQGDRFNPRTPCGVRRGGRGRRAAAGRFQSTHSLRSATDLGVPEDLGVPVSIHALLAECDPGEWEELEEIYCFNPRTPCGVRQ